MEYNKEVINSMLVEIFNNILILEEKVLKKGKYADLSITEMHTLEAIGKNTEKTMSEVAAVLKITVGTLTTAINRLVKKGYVTRRREERDRRIVKIALSPKGKAAYRVHGKFHENMIQYVLHDLDVEQQESLIHVLGKIQDFIRLNYKSN